MKKTRKIIFVVFILIAIAAMFLPVATFNDNSSASMAADIEKQQGKVDSAQTQLDRWIAGGKKSEADIQKQRDKVAKEKEKLDALGLPIVCTGKDAVKLAPLGLSLPCFALDVKADFFAAHNSPSPSFEQWWDEAFNALRASR